MRIPQGEGKKRGKGWTWEKIFNQPLCMSPSGTRIQFQIPQGEGKHGTHFPINSPIQFQIQPHTHCKFSFPVEIKYQVIDGSD